VAPGAYGALTKGGCLVKIAVGPAWASPFVWTRFTETALNVRHPAGTEVNWIFGKGWCPARRHTDLCEKALSWGAEWICFAGCDQVYEPDFLERLYARTREGYEVISAMVPARGYFAWNAGMKPFSPMGWRFKEQKPDENGRVIVRSYRGQQIDGDMVELIQPEDGDVQRINFIGSGVLMFHRDHLMSLKRPWFTESVDPVTYTRHASMDCMFVWRLQAEAGANVWVDTTIQVKHIHPFEIDRTYSERFADYAIPGVGPSDITQFGPVTPQPGVA
jgi:hypothetical protein